MNTPQTKRTLSRRIFRHILTEYLSLLLCCLLGFLVLFLVTDIFDDLQDFLQADASAAHMAAYFLMRQPINLVHILPMSILLSLSFVISNLIRHQELTAIRAAGLSIPSAAMPVWICAGVFSVCLFALNEFVGPQLVRRASELQERLTTNELDIKYRTKSTCLAAPKRPEKRYWFFAVFSHEGRQKGVSVQQFNPVKPGMLWELRAAEAEFVDDHWVFYNGKKWSYRQDDDLPDAEEQFDELTIRSLTESPADLFNVLRPMRELSALDIYRTLRRDPNLPRATVRPLKATFWYRLVFPLSCVIASLYGVGLSMRAQRAGAFKGFAAAVGMMVFYYLVTQLGVLLGKRTFVPGFLAAVVPTLAFMMHGMRVVYVRR